MIDPLMDNPTGREYNYMESYGRWMALAQKFPAGKPKTFAQAQAYKRLVEAGMRRDFAYDTVYNT